MSLVVREAYFVKCEATEGREVSYVESWRSEV